MNLGKLYRENFAEPFYTRIAAHLDDVIPVGLDHLINVNTTINPPVFTPAFDRLLELAVEQSGNAAVVTPVGPRFPLVDIRQIENVRLAVTGLILITAPSPGSPDTAGKIMQLLEHAWPILPQTCMVALHRVSSTHDGRSTLIKQFMKERRAKCAHYGRSGAWVKA